MNPMPTSPSTTSHKVTWREKLGWGCGGWADNYTFNVVLILYMYIYVDYFKMDPVLVGLAVAIPRFFDAITDPILGNWSDNFRSRWGRRRPLIIAGAILCGVLLPLHWLPPMLGTVKNPWYSNGPFLFFTTMGCVYAIAYTIFIVPYTALGFELSDDYEERTHVLCWRRYLGLFGQFFTPLVYTLSVNKNLFPNIHTGAVVMSSIAGLFVIALGIMPALTCRENPSHQKQEKAPLARSLWSVLGNVPYLQQIFGLIVETVLCSAVSGAAGLLVLHYICRSDTDLNGKVQLVQGMLGAAVSVVSLLLMTRLAAKVGKRSGFIAGMLLTAFGYLTFAFTFTPRWPYLFLVSNVLVWLASQGCGLMLDSMCSDICEYEEYRTGRRVEGMLSSFRTFTAKACNAICGITCGLALKFCGYNADLVGTDEGMPETVFLKLKWLYIALPIIGCLCVIAIFLFYPLTKKRMAEIHAELERRKAQ